MAPTSQMAGEGPLTAGAVLCLVVAGGFLGEEEQSPAFEVILPHALILALAKHFCRGVQELFDVMGKQARNQLVGKLLRNAKELCKSPHGNFVLARIIDELPRQRRATIIEQLETMEKGTWKGALALALLNYGSRILERLLQFGPKEEMAAWGRSLIQEAEMLSKHEFGNFVITSMLEHGSFKMRSEILEKLLPKLPELSRQKRSADVVQSLLKYGSSEMRSEILEKLLPILPELSCHEIAHKVVQQAMKYSSDEGLHNIFTALLTPTVFPIVAGNQAFGSNVVKELLFGEEVWKRLKATLPQ